MHLLALIIKMKKSSDYSNSTSTELPTEVA
jgi:hypothetical protein